MGGGGEQQPREPEHDAGGDHCHHCPELHGRDFADDVVSVCNAPEQPDLISDDGGDHAREQRVVAHAADGEHFEAKYCSGQRCAEDRSETCADACHEHDSAIFAA